MIHHAPRGKNQGRRLRWLVWASLLALCIGADALSGADAAAAGAVRLMPPYRTRGDAIDDPVQLKSERKAFQAAYEGYRLAAKEYRDEVREFISKEVRQRQQNIASSYQGQTDQLEQQQFDLRRDAIARLEDFIFRHRDHERYTPDVMFRLAELYYEDTIASYNRAQDNFQREVDLYSRGKLLDPPSDSDRDFSRSVALYKYLHWTPEGAKMPTLSGRLEGITLPKRWPTYAMADAAMYLQGYCEYESGDIQKAIATLSALEDHYPQSKYVAEAWLRVGEMYFDDNEFEQAADAYQKAAKRAFETKDHKNYALALYKLGWSNFQLYRYPDAVRWFQKLIEFEDAQSLSKDAKDKKASELDLRKEAIEYLAKSLAEPTWDDDGCDDFGSETSKGACTILDPRLRPRLYVASVLPPKYDDFPNWQKSLQGEALQKVSTALAAREAVRKDLINGRPYVFDILVTYGNTLYDQKEDDYYRQAVQVLGFVVENYPMSREAQDLQRKIIKSVDILAAAAASYQAMLAKHKSGEKVLQPDEVTDATIGLAMALGDQERQVQERRRYLQMFGKDTAWYQKWGADKDLAAQVEDTVSKVRYDFALLNHAQAQQLRIAGDEEGALRKYGEAAREYEILLRSDMESPNAYNLAWTLAEVLYFSGKRCDALRTKERDLLRIKDPKTGEEGNLVPYPDNLAPQVVSACDQMRKSIEYYALVRDWKGQRTRDAEGKPMDFREQAGLSALAASNLVLNARAAYPLSQKDRMETRNLPDIRPSSKQDEEDQKVVENTDGIVRVKPQLLDAGAVDWIQQVDAYVTSNLEMAKDPSTIQKLALQVSELLYKNRQFDPWKEGETPKTPADFWSARKRFWWIIEKYPQSNQAIEAFKNLITTYLLEKDYKEMQRVAAYGEEHGVGEKKLRQDVFKTLHEIELSAIAKDAAGRWDRANARVTEAEKANSPDDAGLVLADARKTFDEAGDMFYDLRMKVDKPKEQKALLMNSVRAYYKAEKWDKCFKVLKEAEELMRSAKATTPVEKEEIVKILDEIVVTRANLNYQFFNVPEAINDYRLLYDNDPKGKKAAEYLKSAADLAFYNSNWDLAVQLDKDLILRFEKDPDAKRKELVQKSAWRIQEAWQKKGDINKQIDGLESFIARYQADKAVSAKVFKAYGMIAEIYESRGDRKNSERLFKRIVEAFDKGFFEKNGGPEATAAAQSVFMLMKPRYDTFMATKLVENNKLSPTKRMEDLQKQVKDMMDVVLGAMVKQKNPQTGAMEETRTGKDGLFNEYKEKVAAYGSQNWSYAAYLYRGKMLQYLARSIYNAPRPEMSDEELEQYEEILEQFGGQVENQAIRSLETALKDAESKGLVNNWVTELRKAMNQYKPAEYPLLKDEKRLTADPAGTLPMPDKELR
ncbi:MAG: tetratricopeptide repeat protein [Myxococcales bacterium]|nr:tetratricopeptide repeat protein [Myxococcales bacterium]